jgi:hypothetical protein
MREFLDTGASQPLARRFKFSGVLRGRANRLSPRLTALSRGNVGKEMS